MRVIGALNRAENISRRFNCASKTVRNEMLNDDAIEFASTSMPAHKLKYENFGQMNTNRDWVNFENDATVKNYWLESITLHWI